MTEKPQLRWPRLQMALLMLFLNAPRGAELPLDFLQQKVYSSAKKHRPAAARKSVAALIRNTSEKLMYIGAEIERTSELGRESYGMYRLVGNISAVRRSVSNSKKVRPRV